jgi:hypothetical protein
VIRKMQEVRQYLIIFMELININSWLINSF